MNKLAMVQDIIQQMKTFVDQVYVPDTLAIAGFYKDWTTAAKVWATSSPSAIFRLTAWMILPAL